VVLGPTTALKLFPDGSALGSLMNIQHVPFRVVGILVPRGAQGLFNPDDLAVVPVTSAQSMLIAGGSLTSVQRILISATSRDGIGAAYEEVNDLLMQTHRITSPSQVDFTITTQESILQTLDSTSTALTLLLAGVAGISLLVGGIGVMNIMLVSVTERISEIGLRKALGATRGDILRQFLIEASALSAAGGVLGIGLGAGSTFLLNHFTALLTVFSPSAAMIALVIAAGIGLVFGVFPAMRAARLAPIEALRAA
jgi:putative ABC transport system permease protein